MNKKGKMVVAAVIGLIVVLLVVVFVGVPLVRLTVGSSQSILALGDTKCNKHLTQKQYGEQIIKFSPRTYFGGGENTFYEPKLATLNFLGYLSCRDEEVFYDLSDAAVAKIDNEIIKCGNEAFKNHYADLQKEIDKYKEDPEMEDYVDEIKDERKLMETAYKKYLRNVRIPAGRCEFKTDL